MRASGLAFSDFASDFDAQYSIILDAPGLAGTTVDLWFDGTLPDMIDRLAFQLDATPTYDGQVVTFTRSDHPNVILSHYLKAADVAAIANAVDPEASAVAVGNRVALRPDTTEDVRRLVRLLNHRPDSWVLDVLLVELNQSTARDIGLGWSLGATLSARAETGTGLDQTTGPILGAKASAVAEVLARLSAESTLARLAYCGTLYLIDGEPANLQQGDTIPVPRRTTSPEGTVTVEGFDSIQTGFTLDASATQAGELVRLELSPSVSDVAGFVLNEAPIVLTRSLQSVALVKPGDWLVIGGFDRVLERESAFGINTNTPWTSSQRRTRDDVTIIMLVRLTDAS